MGHGDGKGKVSEEVAEGVWWSSGGVGGVWEVEGECVGKAVRKGGTEG